jgi:hypothetical protein
LIVSPVVIFGLLVVGHTILFFLLGGPSEPEAGMSWDEFKNWKESGEWFRQGMTTGLSCIAIPLICGIVVTIITKRKKSLVEPDNPT